MQVGERIREIYVENSTLKDNLGRYIRVSVKNISIQSNFKKNSWAVITNLPEAL